MNPLFSLAPTLCGHMGQRRLQKLVGSTCIFSGPYGNSLVPRIQW